MSAEAYFVLTYLFAGVSFYLLCKYDHLSPEMNINLLIVLGFLMFLICTLAGQETRKDCWDRTKSFKCWEL